MSMYTEIEEIQRAIKAEGQRIAKCESQEWENGDVALAQAMPALDAQRAKLLEIAAKVQELKAMASRYRMESMY